ncbi:MAG: hemolysin III family protein, partial [Chloroflexota bacterium]
MSKSDLKQSRKEEIANTLTHLFALVVSVFGTVLLFGEAIRLRDPYRIAGASVFGSCLISLYLASSLYHFCQRPRVRPAIRHLFHVADQVNIFIFIAATYTPLLLIRLRGSGGWTFLILIWVFALVGSLIKIFYTGRYNIVTRDQVHS